jgi:O-acetylhomoserine/O-acetylserine sulfhydrylase-like pyridoxal-dependent enzyme
MTMAMRLIGEKSVGLVAAASSGSVASMLGAITWLGEGGAIAALTALGGAAVAVFSVIAKSLLGQVRELRADNESLRAQIRDLERRLETRDRRIDHLEAEIQTLRADH